MLLHQHILRPKDYILSLCPAMLCVYPSFAVRFEPRNNVVYTITGAGVAVPAGVLRVPVPLQQAAHHCQPLLGGRGFQNQVNP